MDRVYNPKDEKKTLYEIYRACRLCGAGAGYKMPIIQSIVFDHESHGLELRQKIKECLQIEVNLTDRMPPLICELCVDKVDDFYDFFKMCQQTDKRTRQRLGLPLQTKSKDSPDCETCLRVMSALRVTEPVKHSDVEYVAGPRSKKARREPAEQVASKMEKEKEKERPALSSRSSTPDRQWELRRRSPVHKRTTRQNTESTSSDILAIEDTPEPRTKPKRPREKDLKTETPPPTKKAKLPELKSKEAQKTKEPPKPKETSKPGPRSKTMKEPENQKPITKDPEPPKTTSKPKPASKKDTKPPPQASKSSKTKSKPEPVKTKPEPVKIKPKDEPVKPKPVPRPVETKFICQICNHQVKTSQGLFQHNIVKHVPTFTASKFACNACELWFPLAEECVAHHRLHSDGLPYKCQRCYGYYKLQHEYDSHFGENQCLSVYEVPDVQCWRCYQRFATSSLLSAHRCPGEDARPGGKCSKCNRSYALLKNQLKHEATCTYKKKGEVSIAPEVQARLLNMQVKIARCDSLLSGPRVDVATIPNKYGLDSKARYPYLPPCAKSEPSTEAMLKGSEDSVKAEYWGSFSNDGQKVDKLDKGDDNDDLASKIFSIIDNLDADDTQTGCDSDNVLEKVGDKEQSDSVSLGGDKDGKNNSEGGSDSILDKNDGKNEDSSRVNDESDKMEVVKDVKESDKIEVVKDVPESDSAVSGDDTAAADVKSDETNVGSDNVDEADKMDVDAEKVDDSPKKSGDSVVPIDGSEKMDVDCEKSDEASQNVVVSYVKSEDELIPDAEKRFSVSEDNTGDDNGQKNVDTDVKEKDESAQSSKDNNDDGEHERNKITDELIKNEVADITSNNEGQCEQIRIETSQSTEDKGDDADNLVETKNLDTVYDNSSKNDNLDSPNQSMQDCSLDGNKDKLESHNEESYEIGTNFDKNEKIDLNQEESHPPLINNEVFSKIDEITNKIIKETETSHDNSIDEHNDIEKTQRSDNKSDSISLNSLRSVNDIELQDKFNVDDLSDDDKKLMAELDAQIGESKEKNNEEITNDQIEENDQKDSANGQKESENDGSINVCNDNSGANDEAVVNDSARVNDTVGVNDNYDNQGFTDKNINPADNQNNQNGPSNHQINGNGSNDQRRDSDQKSKDYLIDNLLKKQDDLKSLELVSVSDDEFDFEA